MADPFLAEIRVVSFGYAPQGWALCNGQFLPINQNQALFSLLGTTYGGDGRTTFALPDLRGRTPIHVGDGHVLGERGGEEAHTLTVAELPAHTHAGNASSSPGDDPDPTGNLLASPLNLSYRAPGAGQTSLAPATVASVGGSQAHENMQPYLALNFCIALTGIFPSPN
jgi:microcystin-dependent protein